MGYPANGRHPAVPDNATGDFASGGKPPSKLISRIFEFFVIFALIVLLVVFVRPEIQRSREKTNRVEAAKNLKQIWKAIESYHGTHHQLPPAAVYSKDGKPLYSWRVLLLPYLGEQSLYSQFRLDEP